ncbi:hypothetical protein [Erythrobacter rubeus]|uniref:Lipoprotein n=1 Tax=Erythrobacter rubeus TaxID=2760803 RepID=A0ABR8KMX4_9SPHN|nr:hypothetical protein [Erythrobacter rubeus]MBD2841941.1 hypothetical protein [Erythrobacter rubeus]
MRISAFPLTLVCASLAACSAQPEPSGQSDASAEMVSHEGHHMGPSEEAAREKRQMVAEFVDRFEAQQCEDSELIGTMRRREADGSGLYIRAYQSPVGCAEDMPAVLKSLGFSQTEDGRFVSEDGEGSSEAVLIRIADDGSAAGIEWEVDQQ